MELHSPTDQYEHDHEAYEGNPIRRQLIAGGCEPLQTLDRLRNVVRKTPLLPYVSRTTISLLLLLGMEQPEAGQAL